MNPTPSPITSGEALKDQRRAMFAAFSECLANGSFMTPQEIADKLLAALAQRAGAAASAPVAQSERDALDAKRYRWLRDHSEPGICTFYLSVGKAFHGVKFIPATVDEAIDAQIAAIAAQQPAEGGEAQR